MFTLISVILRASNVPTTRNKQSSVFVLWMSHIDVANIKALGNGRISSTCSFHFVAGSVFILILVTCHDENENSATKSLN